MDNLFDKIKNGTSDTFYIWSEEMKSVFKDQGVLLFVFFLCLAYPLLYAFLYNNEVIREVPIIAVDHSNTSLSREFLRRVDASPDAKIIVHATDMEEAKYIMRKQGAYGIIYMPSSFSKDINRGIQTEVSLYCDMSSLLYYKAILTSCTDVSLAMNKEIKIRKLGNTTEKQDEISTRPIDYTSIAMFNPQNGMASFLIPAVLILIIQQSMLLGIGLSAGTAREKNRFRDLVPIHKKYQGTLRIVLGKSLVYIMIYMLLSAYILIVVPKLFSLIQIATFGTIAAFALPYILACVFFAMTASIAIRNRETCMMLFVFTSLPLLFISGISWPRSAVPEFWQVVSWIFPSTFGINGFVRINSMGATLKDVEPEYNALWLQTGIYFITTCLVYRYQILLSRKHAYTRLREMKRKFGKV